MIRAGVWNLDEIRITDGTIEIQGWALPPGGDHHRSSFTINDVEFEDVEYPAAQGRSDLESIFWYVPDAKSGGFRCRMKNISNGNFTDGSLVIKFVEKRSLSPHNSNHNYHYRTNMNQIPLPEPHRRLKVHGSDHLDSFLIEGYTSYKKIEKALFEISGKTYDDFSAILDWGCGCGRMTRYFSDLKNARVTGIDIDEDNVAWCRKNLRFGDFRTVPLSPPTALEPACFDVVIGISVFTHLKEKDQFGWLQELSRLAKPGAFLFMTVHGELTVSRAGIHHSSYKRLRDSGFLDSGPNRNLDSVMGENDFYRDTFHTHSYIHEEWSLFFDILKIVPGTIGNHQDLIVMQKRRNPSRVETYP